MIKNNQKNPWCSNHNYQTNIAIQHSWNIVKAKDHVLAGILKKYLWAFQKSKSKTINLTEGKLSYKDINNAEMKQVLYIYCILRRLGVKQTSCMTVWMWLVLQPMEKMQHNKQQEATKPTSQNTSQVFIHKTSGKKKY